MLGQLALASAALLGSTLAAPAVPIHPEGPKHIIITSKNTLNATAPPPKIPPQPDSTEELPLIFTNNFSGGSVNAYITGLDSTGALAFVQSDGQFLFPTCDASTGVPQPIAGSLNIPLGGQGSNTDVTLPGYMSSGRVYFSEGLLQFFTVCGGTGLPSLVQPSSITPTDPNSDINWSFAEFTNNDGGLYADISYVDLVGLPLGISMVAGDGSVQSALGLPADAVTSICSSLTSQGNSDGQPWGDLCQSGSNGQPIRAISPQDYISLNTNAFSGYFQDYVDSVWDYYTSNVLTVDTQAGAGDVSCQVSNGELQCAGDNRGYAQPSSNDIFGCNSGPFSIESTDNDVHVAVVPRLCAAFDRTSFLVSGGNVQPGPPSTEYYTTAPTNYWSAFVHALEVDGKGYAFPYDDVTPDGGINQSGVVSDSSPQSLTLIVGGPLS